MLCFYYDFQISINHQGVKCIGRSKFPQSKFRAEKQYVGQARQIIQRKFLNFIANFEVVFEDEIHGIAKSVSSLHALV